MQCHLAASPDVTAQVGLAESTTTENTPAPLKRFCIIHLLQRSCLCLHSSTDTHIKTVVPLSRQDDYDSICRAFCHISYLAKARGKDYKRHQTENYGVNRG